MKNQTYSFNNFPATTDADAVIRMWEDRPIRFFTNGEQRMVITSNNGGATEGYVYVGDNFPGPTSRLDIDGDLRVREVNVATPDALFVGVQNIVGGNPVVNDLNVRRLDFNGNVNNYLAGNGTWQSFSNITGIGNYCGIVPQNPIIGDYEIPMDGFSYNFTTGTNDNGRVNIGNMTCGYNFPARLYVEQSQAIPGIPVHLGIVSFTNGASFPLYEPVYSSSGIVQNAQSMFHAGVYGTSINAANLFGNSYGFGVWGTASANDINVGVFGRVTDASANANIAIYGSASAAAVNYAGYFDGNVYIAGTYGPSDQMLKTNVQDVSNAIDIINQLEPKTFEFDQMSYPTMNLEGGNQFGLIAQDVQSILPELVNTNFHPAQYDTLGNEIAAEFSFLGLEYTELIPILIAGMKEQQVMIETLQNCLANAGICQNGARINNESDETRTEVDVALSDGQNIILNQNVPNPFAERTTITYDLPESVQKAQIHFYNAQGKLINTIDLLERGAGQLNVFADDLSTGIYIYSLVADGKIISTKRMIKQ